VRARRSAETLDQMSARMEAMAAQQAALEAHVVKISSEKEHLIQQARRTAALLAVLGHLFRDLATPTSMRRDITTGQSCQAVGTQYCTSCIERALADSRLARRLQDGQRPFKCALPDLRLVFGCCRCT